LANGDDLGMRGGIVRRCDLVGSFGDDFAIANNDTAEWATGAPGYILNRERDRSRHEYSLHFTHNKGEREWAPGCRTESL
jgi:hypothetical protein